MIGLIWTKQYGKWHKFEIRIFQIIHCFNNNNNVCKRIGLCDSEWASATSAIRMYPSNCTIFDVCLPPSLSLLLCCTDTYKLNYYLHPLQSLCVCADVFTIWRMQWTMWIIIASGREKQRISEGIFRIDKMRSKDYCTFRTLVETHNQCSKSIGAIEFPE